MPTAHILVKGRVQGVFYRQSTREKAKALGLSGWVRNLPDGRVEIEASGPRTQLDALVDWSQDGPPHAAVDSIDVKWTDTEKHQGIFAIV
jgi:acylphosphatase